MKRSLTHPLMRTVILTVCLALNLAVLSACSSLRYRSHVGISDGLVGYWGFDSGDARDDSGNGLAGRLMGCSPVDDARSKRKSALKFNGHYDFILVPHDNACDFGKGPFTLSCWIKTTGETGSGAQRDDLVTNGDATQTGFALSLENNRMALFYGWQQAFIGTTPVNDGEWHHLLAERDSQGFVALYLDGRPERVGKTGTGYGGNVDPTGMDNVTTQNPLIFGRHGTKNESFFSGALDEVRIYNRALSAAEVARLYAGHEKRSGLRDSKPAQSADGRTPKTIPGNHGLRFDGQNDFAYIAPSATLDLRGSMTISAWVKANRPLNGQVQIFWRGDTQGGRDPYQLAFHHDGRMRFEIDAGDGLMPPWGEHVFSSQPVDLDYHFWTGVYDADQSKIFLYRDGVLDASADATVAFNYDTSNMWNMIGAVDSGNWQCFDGSIAEISLWDVARSPVQILQDMNGDLTGNEGGLVGYWKLNEGSDQIAHDLTSHGNHARLGTSTDFDDSDPDWMIHRSMTQGLQRGK